MSACNEAHQCHLHMSQGVESNGHHVNIEICLPRDPALSPQSFVDFNQIQIK